MRQARWAVVSQHYRRTNDPPFCPYLNARAVRTTHRVERPKALSDGRMVLPNAFPPRRDTTPKRPIRRMVIELAERTDDEQRLETASDHHHVHVATIALLENNELLQRGRQRTGVSRPDCSVRIGGTFTRARHEQRDELGEDADDVEHHEHQTETQDAAGSDEALLLVNLARQLVEQVGVRAIDESRLEQPRHAGRKQNREDRTHRRHHRSDAGVVVLHVREFVRDDGFQLVVVEVGVEQTFGDGDESGAVTAPGGESVSNRHRGNIDLGLNLQAGLREDLVDDTHQTLMFGVVLAGSFAAGEFLDEVRAAKPAEHGQNGGQRQNDDADAKVKPEQVQRARDKGSHENETKNRLRESLGETRIDIAGVEVRQLLIGHGTPCVMAPNTVALNAGQAEISASYTKTAGTTEL